MSLFFSKTKATEQRIPSPSPRTGTGTQPPCRLRLPQPELNTGDSRQAQVIAFWMVVAVMSASWYGRNCSSEETEAKRLSSAAARLHIRSRLAAGNVIHPLEQLQLKLELRLLEALMIYPPFRLYCLIKCYIALKGNAPIHDEKRVWSICSNG
ncbi:unnamed protein product [Linum tenue]|uniref:Uncharacterized protein n=1 Tax=Linum tenue TaxID=586396 RepID=A0AAV0P206_9ROSI|nr:unnamed protein product [Linum tenue]